MIDNLQNYGSKRYLVSGNIEVELFVEHGIEAASFDTCVCFGQADAITVQSELNVRVCRRKYREKSSWLSLIETTIPTLPMNIVR